MGLTKARSGYKSGIYRVVSELLFELNKQPGLDIAYSHTALLEYISFTKQHLREEGTSEKLCNDLYFNYPKTLFGRGGRYFNLLYKLLGIDVNRLSYDNQMIEKAHVFHSLFHPIPDALKKYPGLKRILTVYDLIPILLPEYFVSQEFLKDAIQSIGNDYAICISEQTRNDLLSYHKEMDPGKAFVIYLAADPVKFYPCTSNEKFAAIRKKYLLPENYMLSLCTLEPRKNLDHLVRSFLRFIREQRVNDMHLVLVGTDGWLFDKVYHAIEGAGQMKDRIIMTGRIPDEDLASIYSNAHSFYYLSKYEGFGLPPLEAMQCGVPTVTSNGSSLPEVVGDGGIMVSPDDEDALCDTMYRLYTDSRLREGYKIKAIERAKLFSWEKCAREHLEVYNTILQ